MICEFFEKLFNCVEVEPISELSVEQQIWQILGIHVDFSNTRNFKTLHTFLFNELQGFDSIQKLDFDTYEEAFLYYFLNVLKFIQSKYGDEAMNKFRQRFVRCSWE